MREIKCLGSKVKGSRCYKVSLFVCDFCLKEVEKIRKDGLKAKFCSHKCYAKNREKRGAYKDFVMISGYKYIQRPDHPNATKKGYVAEHRIIAENSIGRILLDDECVHHINEIKTDNRPENLMVMKNSEHMKLHKKGAHRDEFGKFAIKI